MTTVKYLLIVGYLLAATLCIAQTPVDLRQIGDVPIDVAEAEFLRLRPEAKPLKLPKYDDKVSYFLYEPGGLILFGQEVTGVGRGFEAGRGCAVAVGFTRVSADKIEGVLNDVAAALGANPKERKDSQENMWLYYESSQLYGAVVVNPPQPDMTFRTITLTVSDKRCDAELAASLWQSRAR